MRAIGYTRVSSAGQATEGVSLAAQAQQIRGYCRAKSWQLVEIFSDEGRSGKDLERQALQAALALLDEHRADALIVTKLDRLGRRTRDVLMLIDERFAHNGAALVSITEGIDPTTPGGRLVITILAGLGEWERAVIIERTKAALDHLRANGRPTGPLPFGKKLDSQGQLVADPDAVRQLRKARRLRREGKSWRKISAAMQWTISQCRTRLDASYREKTRAAAAERRRGGTR